MSQPFDVMAAAVFARAALACGVSRLGTYRPSEDSQDIMPCTATVNMDTTSMANIGAAPNLMSRSAQIALLRAEIAVAPPRGAVVVVDNVKYVVDRVDNVQPGFWLTLCTNKGAAT